MKTLAIIWALVVITGTTTGVYINNAVDQAIRLSAAYQVQPAEGIDLGNNTCLQNCQPVDVQPAADYNVLLTNKTIR